MLYSLSVAVKQYLDLVFESPGLDGAVNATLLGSVLLPPPAAGACVFPRLGGPGTRGAANAGVALVVQRVIRNVVGVDVVPHLLIHPVGEGIDLEQPPMIVVDLY